MSCWMRRGRKGRGERGQALVELAVALPVLILLLLAVMEFGFLFSSYLQVLHGAREGIRAGALGASDAEIRQRVEDAAPQLDPGRLVVEVDPAESNRHPGDMLRVTVRYRYETLVPLIGGLLGDSIDLEVAYRMRVE